MRRASALFVLALVSSGAITGCKRTPAPPQSTPIQSSASASNSASSPVPTSPSVTASFAPPDHWSTVSRDPKTDALFGRRPPRPLFLAASIESDDGPEGDLYLERDGETLFGRWGLTVVDGKLAADGKAFTLRDVGTEQTIFEGKRDEGATITGVIGAEGMLRGVRSLPPRPLAELSFALTHGEGGRLFALQVEDGVVKRATFSTSGKNAKKDTPFTVRREPDRLIIVGDRGRGDWILWPTAAGVLGRSTSGRLVRQDSASSSGGPKPLPFRRDAVFIGKTHLRKGKPNTNCDIDVELPDVRGIPNAEAVETSLRRAVIDAGVGMWPSGEPPPTLAAFVCQNDRSVDLQIQSADTTVTPLPGGFLGLEVKGYARFSAMGGATATSACLLLDTTQGELISDLLNKLPDEVTEVVRIQTDRALKRDMRSAKLDRDDFYVVESLESMSTGISVCPSSTGLRVLIALGTTTKNLGGSGPIAVEVPSRHLLPHLPEGHRFRGLFSPR